MPIIPVHQTWKSKNETKARRIRAEKVGCLYVHRRVIGDGFDDHLWTVSAAVPDTTKDPEGHAAITMFARDREAAVNLAEMLCVIADWSSIASTDDVRVFREVEPIKFRAIVKLIDAAR